MRGCSKTGRRDIVSDKTKSYLAGIFRGSTFAWTHFGSRSVTKRGRLGLTLAVRKEPYVPQSDLCIRVSYDCAFFYSYPNDVGAGKLGPKRAAARDAAD
jgi:hypothetical protein